MTETQLVHQIIEFLNYSGLCYVWRINSGVVKSEYQGKTRMIRMAQKGTSDIAGIRKRDGRYIVLEVKLPKTRGTVTLLQQEYLEKMKAYGAVIGVVTSAEEAAMVVSDESIYIQTR